MAVDMFINMKGIKGESKDAKHPGETDVLAWSWGMTNNGTAHVGGGTGSGKVNVHDLSFTKYLDTGSTDLLKACCTGTHIDNAVLVVRKAGGKVPLEYLTITMEQVLVVGVSAGGSGGEDRFTENVSLNFAKVKVKYIEQTALGAEGDKPDMSWDIAANKTY